MKAKGSGNFVNIDIGDMVNVSRYHSIKNFYLSHLDFKEHLFKEGVPFTFNGFYISLCLAGEAGLRISGRSCPVRPGTLLVLAPNQLIEPYHISPDYDSRSIIVSLDEILAFPSPIDINIMNAAVRTPSVNLPGQRPARLLEYYDFLEKQYLETGNAYREEISKTLFYALMLEICDIFRSVSGEDGSVQRPRQEKLTAPASNSTDLFDAAFRLFCTNRPSRPVRSLSVRACGLSPAEEAPQLSLFPEDVKRRKREDLEQAVDRIRAKYGYTGIRRGIQLLDPALDLDAKGSHIIHPIGFLGTLS